MSIEPLTFTGVSTFSSDLQTILNRAVSIASLPVTSLQNQMSDITTKKLLVSNLGDVVGSLADSVGALAALGASKALTASTSDSTKVTATATGATAATTYTITNVTSIAAAASETSVQGYGDEEAVSSTGTVELTIGEQTYTITLEEGKNNLAGLRDAINALGAGVTASVFTTGSGDKPNYLSLSANNTGATTLKLVDDPEGAATSLITSANQGANTEFDLNGVHVSKPGTLISSVIPGVTLNVLATTDADEKVTVTLSSSRTKLSDALGDLVSAYNSTASQVNAQIGASAGLLSGHSIIRQTRQAMLSLANYSGAGGSMTSLAELGIEFSTSGEMSLNQDTFDALTDEQLQAAFTFFGDSTSGLSQLKSVFTQISDPATGAVAQINDQFTEANDRIQDQVDAITDRVTIMQQALKTKLQLADTLLATLASQKSLLTASIDSLNYSTYGKQDS
jgi:flagellar hook-associated protein 2